MKDAGPTGGAARKGTRGTCGWPLVPARWATRRLSLPPRYAHLGTSTRGRSHAMISWSGGCPSGRETWSPDHTPIPQMASQRPVVRHSDALRVRTKVLGHRFGTMANWVLGSRWLQWMSPGGRPGGQSVTTTRRHESPTLCVKLPAAGSRNQPATGASAMVACDHNYSAERRLACVPSRPPRRPAVATATTALLPDTRTDPPVA